MFKVLNGNIFDSKCLIKTNPTNSVGVMGKGLALYFNRKFPNETAHFNDYSISYQANFKTFKLMEPMLYRNINVLMFPTKIHWSKPSKIEYIKNNAQSAKRVLMENESPSIAFPALGCGLGGLDFKKVLDVLEKEFNDYDGDVEVYSPNV